MTINLTTIAGVYLAMLVAYWLGRRRGREEAAQGGYVLALKEVAEGRLEITEDDAAEFLANLEGEGL